MYIYKLFNKRNSLIVSKVQMPHIDSNISQFIFYPAIKGEIAWSTRRLNDCTR